MASHGDHNSRTAKDPVKNLKVIEKAMAIPVVSSACSGVTRMTYPYVELMLRNVTHVVDTTWNMVAPVVSTVKSQVEERLIPIIPSKVFFTMHILQIVAVNNFSAAVENADNFAAGGIDQLTDKVPQLKEATPKLIENTRVSVSSYFSAVTEYAVSFSVIQMALKAVDSILELVDGVLGLLVSEDKENAKNGFRTDTVYEDEHAKVVVNKSEEEETEPVVVNTEE